MENKVIIKNLHQTSFSRGHIRDRTFKITIEIKIRLILNPLLICMNVPGIE